MRGRRDQSADYYPYDKLRVLNDIKSADKIGKTDKKGYWLGDETPFDIMAQVIVEAGLWLIGIFMTIWVIFNILI